MTVDYDLAAELLADARNAVKPIAELPPGCRPASIDDAYVIQDRIVKATGAVGGWKVGESSRGGPIVCAPINIINIHPSGAKLDLQSLYDAGIEIEFAFRLERDFAVSEQGYAAADILDGVSLCPLIEIIASRFLRKQDVGAWDRLADTQSSGHFVVGTPLPDWRDIDLKIQPAELLIDGTSCQTSSTISSAGDPFDLLVWQVNHCAGRGGMRAGDIVTTGSLAGATPISAGAVAGAEADFGALGRVSVLFNSNIRP